MSIHGKAVIKGFVVAGLTALAFGVAAPRTAEADSRIPMPGGPISTTPGGLLVGTQVSMACENPGTHQDVAKSPLLRNTSGATLAKGQKIYWSATDKDKGSVTLQADLAPNGTVQAMGTAGNGYQCSAYFLTSPDLVVNKAAWTSATSINVEVRNVDAWVDAGASSTKVEVVSCSGQVLASTSVATAMVPKGQLRGMVVTVPATSGKRYLRVTADAGKAVGERNEQNNLMDGMESCIH